MAAVIMVLVMGIIWGLMSIGRRRQRVHLAAGEGVVARYRVRWRGEQPRHPARWGWAKLLLGPGVLELRRARHSLPNMWLDGLRVDDVRPRAKRERVPDDWVVLLCTDGHGARLELGLPAVDAAAVREYLERAAAPRVSYGVAPAIPVTVPLTPGWGERIAWGVVGLIMLVCGVLAIGGQQVNAQVQAVDTEWGTCTVAWDQGRWSGVGDVDCDGATQVGSTLLVLALGWPFDGQAVDVTVTPVVVGVVLLLALLVAGLVTRRRKRRTAAAARGDLSQVPPLGSGAAAPDAVVPVTVPTPTTHG